jgi:D-alanine-D-alanine ligase
MKTIAVVFGGRSAEHDVSIITALTSVIKPLELTKKYRVIPVYIAKDGRWFTDERLKDVRLYQGDGLENFLKRTKPTGVLFDGGMKLLVPAAVGRKEVAVDVVFPAMHGTYGEDGALMGMLDMAGIAYVGCGVAASAIAMDKLLAKQVAYANGISVTSFVSFRKHEIAQDLSRVVKKSTDKLAYPLFVKPAHLGSSIGISRVQNDAELSNALEVAVHYDDLVIVEEAVQNLIEVTLPIIGLADSPRPALLEQPLTVAKDFFDFDTKYLRGGKKGGGKKSSTSGSQGYSQIPADLPKALYDQAEAVGLAAYSTLGCSGIARVDMLIDSKAGTVYFNEINPLPGSLYAHNWVQAGVSKVALVEKLLEFAEQRHTEREKLATTFDTNFLKQF